MKKRAILLVDDDPQYLRLVANLIDQSRFQTHCASSGQRALEILSASSCELLITDLQMPGMNGYELSMLARKLVPELRIVLVTGAASPEVCRLADEVGISRVLAKPCKVEQFLEILEEVRPAAQLQESNGLAPDVGAAG